MINWMKVGKSYKEKNLEKENINELIMLFLNKLGEKLEGKNFEEILKNCR